MSARCRSEKGTMSFIRHGQMTIKNVVVSAQHHDVPKHVWTCTYTHCRRPCWHADGPNEKVALAAPVMVDLLFLVEQVVPPVLVEHVALAVACATQAPVIGHVAHALVIEHIKPQPSVT